MEYEGKHTAQYKNVHKGLRVELGSKVDHTFELGEIVILYELDLLLQFLAGRI